MAEKSPPIEQGYPDGYWDPQNVDLPDDHPIIQMYREQQLIFPEGFDDYPEPGSPPVEYERVKLDDGSYELIAVRYWPHPA